MCVCASINTDYSLSAESLSLYVNVFLCDFVIFQEDSLSEEH